MYVCDGIVISKRRKRRKNEDDDRNKKKNKTDIGTYEQKSIRRVEQQPAEQANIM